MSSRRRRFGAAGFAFGSAVLLAGAGACAGRSIAGEEDGARGGEAGEPGSGGARGGSAGARAGGTGGTTPSTGGKAGRGGSGAGPRGGSGSSGDAGETGTAGEAPDGSGGAGAGASSGGRSGAGAGGVNAGMGGSGGWTFRGICDQRAVGTVTTTTYVGLEEFVIVSEQAVLDGRADDPTDEDLVCRIRFEVHRVGAAPPGCVDPDGLPCEWSHRVEYANPQVLIDVNGACARSEIVWDQAFIDETDGSSVSYGYIYMYLGHDSVVMIYSESTSDWVDFARAFWDGETGEFEFRNRLGACRY